jgi:hypothetical protein
VREREAIESKLSELDVCFSYFLLPILSASWTSITIWVVSAILAAGIGWSRYEKKKNRDKLLHDLAALTPDRREQLLARLRPELQMEVRQQLMQRYGLS